MYKVILLFTIIVALIGAYPIQEDSEGAATGDEHHGRVQIKVYRGPSEHEHHFAPWGYWVKQPADHHH